MKQKYIYVDINVNNYLCEITKSSKMNLIYNHVSSLFSGHKRMMLCFASYVVSLELRPEVAFV